MSSAKGLESFFSRASCVSSLQFLTPRLISEERERERILNVKLSCHFLLLLLLLSHRWREEKSKRRFQAKKKYRARLSWNWVIYYGKCSLALHIWYNADFQDFKDKVLSFFLFFSFLWQLKMPRAICCYKPFFQQTDAKKKKKEAALQKATHSTVVPPGGSERKIPSFKQNTFNIFDPRPKLSSFFKTLKDEFANLSSFFQTLKDEFAYDLTWIVHKLWEMVFWQSTGKCLFVSYV